MYSQTWINLLVDDHHFGNITKSSHFQKCCLKIKKNNYLFSWGDVSFTADQSGLLLMSFILFQSWFKFRILVCGLGGDVCVCVFAVFFGAFLKATFLGV